MEQKFRPKLMFTNPFFCLKIGRFKATAHRVVYPSMLKQGLQIWQILLTWRLNFWQVLTINTMVGATVGISRPSQHDMPVDQKPGRSKMRQICRLWHIGQSPLAHRAVTAAICQSPQPLHELPQLGK
jgi:hypothetical protein